MNPFVTFPVLLLFCASSLHAQFTELAPMPEPVSNNAVAGAQVNGKNYVYSFCGIDSSKIWSGIHLKAWRYDVDAGEWTQLPDVPDPDGGKIAAAASAVNGKIYVIGGYHVAQSGNETSSNKVHVFDTQTNTWLADAAPVPVAIDDHVQVVWKDSLIYVVTGWSNTTNVNKVQVFDPSVNQWSEGTPLPNQNVYKVFGGAGTVVEDTIFYAGGAKATVNFPATSTLRKGVIDPLDPTNITWSEMDEPAAKGYRMAATTFGGKAIWLGGSDVTYNFDGIAYSNSAGVPPLDRITVFDPQNSSFFQTNGNMPAVMDLRGAAKISEDEIIIAGGMAGGQQVSNKVWRIRLDKLSGVDDNEGELGFYKIYPNPSFDEINVEMRGRFEIEIYDAKGTLLFYDSAREQTSVNVAYFPAGIYWVDLTAENGLRATEKVVIKK
ncbi:MAG TPA: T9SS type A sorting domain-containing protein [Bacteroidetes bacterium]|nr:T9SS type A sorting domain-containing protein [Bacteroidota bacterium]